MTDFSELSDEELLQEESRRWLTFRHILWGNPVGPAREEWHAAHDEVRKRGLLGEIVWEAVENPEK